MSLNDWYQDFISLFYPNLCWSCEAVIYQSGEGICPKCLLTLPYTNFHDDPENIVNKVFWGRLPLMGATALFYFNKQTRVQQLIHKLKYKSKPQVGVLLGQMLGSQLLKSEVFNVIEVVVPVPLHPAKKQKRGYNQAAKIAEGIALAMEITYEENGMIRTKHTETQTRKTRAERVKNMRGVFTANPKSNLEGKNILLVDDVLTTGSTLESCALELLQVSNIKIWIATLAYAE